MTLTEELNVDDLSPTQYLIVETLTARARLGEPYWTFPTSVRKAVRELADRGVVQWKSGVVPKTVQVWLTDLGRLAALAFNYQIPILKQIADEIVDYPGPDPSPASPAWWAGYTEAREDCARFVLTGIWSQANVSS